MSSLVTIHFTLLSILHGLRGRVACEAYHNKIATGAIYLMGSCRHNFGAHNGVHNDGSRDRAQVVHKVCTTLSSNPISTSVRTDCTHTCNITHRAFTMGVNEPYVSLSLHLNSHRDCSSQRSLYSFSAVQIFTSGLDTRQKRISESTLNFVYLFMVCSTHTNS